MAALNNNIKTGNFIPGSETYTRPEEIAIMSKYLKSGIQNLRDSLDLGERSTVFTAPGQAEMKNISSLPGKETIDSLQREDISLSKLSESLEIQKEIRLSKHLENIEEKREISLPQYSLEKISKSNTELYKEISEKIKGNEDGNALEVTENVYDGIFWKNPRVDKRILPDSENKDSKFRELDSLLGGIHFDKYSQEGLAQSKNPSVDAQKVYNEGSDVVFVRSEELKKNNPDLFLEKREGLKGNKEIEKLGGDVEGLNKSTELPSLVEESYVIESSKNVLNLDKYQDHLEKTEKDLNLSDKLIKEERNKEPIKLSEELDKIKHSNELELSEIRDILDSDNKKSALSEFLDKILDGEVESLTNLKEAIPGDLKKVILVDYLKDKIKDDSIEKLHESFVKMPKEEVDIVLDTFVDRLSRDLKEVVQLNKDYITLGKNKGSKNFLEDLYTNLFQLVNSNFSPFIPGEVKDAALKFGAEKIIEPTEKHKEFQNQLKKLYELSTVTSEELEKVLDDLNNYNGNWGKKVSAYLVSMLGKYKKFKKYLPEKEIDKFKKLTIATFEERDYEGFLKDTGTVTKETLIRNTFDLLKKLTIKKAENTKNILTREDLQNIISSNEMYSLSTKEQEYGKPITFRNAMTDIKVELVDKTWETIKSWLTSVMNESLFGTTASLLLDKAKLPGQDYGHDITVRNVPNVVGFYDKKTHTTEFSSTRTTALETKSSVSSGISNWLSGTVNKKKYGFKENYLLAKGVKQTLKDLCETDVNQISSVEDLFDVLKNSEAMTAHARTEEGVMNGMTLSSNHVWEITIEPYLSDFNGNCTWLPFIHEINRNNYEVHGVRTIYDKWLPITSFELQDKRLVNKTLALYSGEISYPIAIEHTNELRLTFSDDSFKSFKTYFDKVAEVSAYESNINTKVDYSIAKQDYIKIKQRTFTSSAKDQSTYDSVNRTEFAVGMYKNLCFSVNIYILTPQYSTIKKYNLLCVMKDYSIDYVGEIDSGPADVTVSFSIVGDASLEDIKYKFETSKLSEDTMTSLNKKINMDIEASSTIPIESQVVPITVMDIEIEDKWDEEYVENTGPIYGQRELIELGEIPSSESADEYWYNYFNGGEEETRLSH